MSTVENLIYPLPPTDEGWHVVGRENELFAEGACHGAQIEGVRIGVFLVEGRVYALNDICTHGNALLSEGDLEGHEIECPLHAGAFDVRTGEALCSPLTRDARWHEARLEDGWVSVRLNREHTANGQ